MCEPCEYTETCPMMSIQRKWALKCTEDCEMKTALRIIKQWDEKYRKEAPCEKSGSYTCC